MEFSTILGLIVALIGLLVGMMFKGVEFSALANPAAIFIILVGTTGAVLNAFPGREAKKIGTLFKLVFSNTKTPYSNEEVINLLTDYAQIARKDGLLALEGKMKEVNDPFLRRGLSMITMGESSDRIEDTLMTDIESMEQRHQGYASVFTQAGTYAPTLGVLGAVIGLIAALANMSDQEALGHAISGAFMATVFGIFTGYVLWHPFANKLKRKSKAEVLNKRIILEGILFINEGVAPNIIKEKMLSFISNGERERNFADAQS